MLADPAPGKVIVNIGCNKGLDAIRWLTEFGEKDVSFAAWEQEIERQAANLMRKVEPERNIERIRSIWRGPCRRQNEGAKERAPDFGRDAGARVFCVEAVPQTAAMLRGAAEELRKSADELSIRVPREAKHRVRSFH